MAMYKVLITDELSPQALERLKTAEDASFDVICRPSLEQLR